MELTHRNFAFLVLSALQYMPRAGAWPNRRLLLFLPLSHVFARFMEFFSFGGTISLALSSNMKTMVKDFETFGPTLLLAVPRVYEKVYNAASQRAGTGFAGKMFMRAAENAREWSKAEQKGEQLPIAGRIAHAFYEQVVYKKIRTIFGPNADFAITGGAPMDSELSHFFNGIGMPVLEGYGMTETCGPVCVSLPEDNRIGTIGMRCAVSPPALPRTASWWSRDRWCAGATTTTLRSPPSRSPMAGCTPAIWAISPKTASSPSPAVRKTSSSPLVARTCRRVCWSFRNDLACGQPVLGYWR